MYAMEKRDNLTIKCVSELTGVAVQTLRAWERRYGIPKPGRIASNRYRFYGEQDIADVLWIKQRIESGVPPSQASAALRAQRAAAAPAATTDRTSHPIAAHAAALEQALLVPDERQAQRALDEAYALYQPEQVALQIIAPALTAVGDKWQQGYLPVWHEHLASNLVWRKLTSIRQAQPPMPDAAPHLVAACAPEEEHEIGLLSFSLLAGRHGWRVSYLGRRTPLADLVDYAGRTEPDLIAISASTVVGLAQLIPLLVESNRPEGKLAFGGRLVEQNGALCEHLPGIVPDEGVLGDMRLLSGVTSPQRLWSPAKPALAAAFEMSAARFALAANIGMQLASMSKQQPVRSTYFGVLNLVESLSCAMAFDAPELMDAQGAWIADFLTSRSIPAGWAASATEICGRACAKLLSADASRLANPLLERMRARIGATGEDRRKDSVK